MIKKSQPNIPVTTKEVVVMKERRIHSKDLNPSFQTFCGDFKAYLARKIDRQHVSRGKGDETNGKNSFTVFDANTAV